MGEEEVPKWEIARRLKVKTDPYFPSRLSLSSNPRNFPIKTPRIEGLSDRDLTIVCNMEADPLSTFISVSFDLLHILGAVVQLTNRDLRRVYAKISKDGMLQPKYEISVPLGMFLHLGGTKSDQKLIGVTGELFEEFEPIKSIQFDIVVKPESNIVPRIRRALSNVGVSLGMELFLWDNVSVIVSRIISMEGEDVFAGGKAKKAEISCETF